MINKAILMSMLILATMYTHAQEAPQRDRRMLPIFLGIAAISISGYWLYRYLSDAKPPAPPALSGLNGQSNSISGAPAIAAQNQQNNQRAGSTSINTGPQHNVPPMPVLGRATAPVTIPLSGLNGQSSTTSAATPVIAVTLNQQNSQSSGSTPINSAPEYNVLSIPAGGINATAPVSQTPMNRTPVRPHTAIPSGTMAANELPADYTLAAVTMDSSIAQQISASDENQLRNLLQLPGIRITASPNEADPSVPVISPAPGRSLLQRRPRRTQSQSGPSTVLPESSHLRVSSAHLPSGISQLPGVSPTDDRRSLKTQSQPPDLLALPDTLDPEAPSFPSESATSQAPDISVRGNQLSRSLSQRDIARAVLAVAASTDLITIDKLLARPDLQSDNYLRQKLNDIKALASITTELQDELRQESGQAEIEQSEEVTTFIGKLDQLKQHANMDQALLDFIREQHQILATIHKNILAHVSRHYRDGSQGQSVPTVHHRRLSSILTPPNLERPYAQQPLTPAAHHRRLNSNQESQS